MSETSLQKTPTSIPFASPLHSPACCLRSISIVAKSMGPCSLFNTAGNRTECKDLPAVHCHTLPLSDGTRQLGSLQEQDQERYFNAVETVFQFAKQRSTTI